MKAFISYSVNDKEQYIVTALSFKLREKRLTISTSQNFYSSTLDFGTKSDIDSSHLFIGIITGQGNETNRVLQEWWYAESRNIPAFLLIEDTVMVDSSFRGNYIRFSRQHPNLAISKINEIHDKMMSNAGPKPTEGEVIAWVLGGAALVAVIGLLATNSEDNNKKKSTKTVSSTSKTIHNKLTNTGKKSGTGSSVKSGGAAVKSTGNATRHLSPTTRTNNKATKKNQPR